MLLKKIQKSLLTAAVSLAVGFSSAAYAATVEDGTAAVVNDDIILLSELDQAQSAVEKNFRQKGSEIDPLNARRAALEGLITRHIILQQAEAQGMHLTDAQIDQALSSAAANTGTSAEKLLASFNRGSEAANRQAFAEELLINEMRNIRVRSRIRISDAEVALLADSLKNMGNVEPSYHLEQLVLPLSANATFAEADRVSALARRIKKKAAEGEDLNVLAAKYSSGSLASRGADLGYIPESQVPVPFLPAILKLKPGEIAGPIRSPFGMHLIKLVDVSNRSVEPVITYKARHILLTTSIIFPDEAAVNQLNALRTAILNGEISFYDAAVKYSEDSGSAATGGELGYAPAGIYDPGFAAGLVKLNVGQISEPVKSSFGRHLILLEDKKVEKNSDEAFRQRAKELISQRLFAEESMAWERELRAGAFIRITDPVLLQYAAQEDMSLKE